MKTAAELKCGEKVIINDVNIQHPSAKRLLEDRKSVVQGKSVDLGGRRIIKKKNNQEKKKKKNKEKIGHEKT